MHRGCGCYVRGFRVSAAQYNAAIFSGVLHFLGVQTRQRLLRIALCRRHCRHNVCHERTFRKVVVFSDYVCSLRHNNEFYSQVYVLKS